MNANEYQLSALTTLNKTLSTEQVLTNGVMGLCGEAGECCDLMKKHLFQGHALDRDKLIDELGDVLWYAAVTAHALGAGLDEVMEHNIEKLKKRYPEGFDADKSVHRAEYNEK